MTRAAPANRLCGTTSATLRSWRLVFCLLALQCKAPAQVDPLPEALFAHFYSNKVALRLHPVERENLATLYANIVFHTEDKKLTMDWYYRADGAEPDDHLEEYSLYPTAICRRAGVDPVFYVAGYYERTGHVVVEQWVIEGVALAAYTAGRAPQSGLSKTVTRTVVLLSSDLKPLRSLAYVAPRERLWLFEEESPHVVWEFDPRETGSEVAVHDSMEIPELAALFKVKTFMIKDSAPDGGGFVMLLYPWRAWDHPSGPHIDSDTELFLFRDGNQDGVFDETGVMTWAQYDNVRRYIEFNDPAYTLP